MGLTAPTATSAMAETLETLYFMKNSDKFGGKLNVVHTLCRLYS